jgi:hypothetical protein
VHREVRRSPHIVPLGAQPPELDVTCAQPQARTISMGNTTIKIIRSHRAL